MTPTAKHSPPPRFTPAVIARSIQSPDSRVSRPTRMRGLPPSSGLSSARVLARATPTRVTVFGSSGKAPAVPLMPSVPNSLFMACPSPINPHMNGLVTDRMHCDLRGEIRRLDHDPRLHQIRSLTRAHALEIEKRPDSCPVERIKNLARSLQLDGDGLRLTLDLMLCTGWKR